MADYRLHTYRIHIGQVSDIKHVREIVRAIRQMHLTGLNEADMQGNFMNGSTWEGGSWR